MYSYTSDPKHSATANPILSYPPRSDPIPTVLARQYYIPNYGFLAVNGCLLLFILAAAICLCRHLQDQGHQCDAKYKLYSTLMSGTPSMSRTSRERAAARGGERDYSMQRVIIISSDEDNY